jgi:hypothetical protein
MVELGLGKNMVRALRFWVDVMGIAVPRGIAGFELTRFAHAVLGPSGYDPYLEDRRTLWLLHWFLSSRPDGPLFAWYFLLNEWPYAEFTRTEALAAFTRESARHGFTHSQVTLAQHLDVFLHTYISSRTSAAVEDSLDSPLVELNFLQVVGDRRAVGGRREPLYSFRRDAKPDVTTDVFAFCLFDFWRQRYEEDSTLTLRTVTVDTGSPGAVFKLTDDAVRSRLEQYSRAVPGAPFVYKPSAVQGILTRDPGLTFDGVLRTVYGRTEHV